MNLTATSVTPFSIDLEWRPPDESEWNGILRGYQLRYAETESLTSLPLFWIEIHIPNVTTHDLRMLQPSTSYCIQVAAATVGLGPYTQPLYILTSDMNDTTTTSGSGSGNNRTVVSGDTNTTVTGSGGFESMKNSTNTTRSDGSGSESISAATIAGVVIGAVVVVVMVSAGSVAVGLTVWRRQHAHKSQRLNNYHVYKKNTSI